MKELHEGKDTGGVSTTVTVQDRSGIVEYRSNGYFRRVGRGSEAWGGGESLFRG